MLTDVLRVPPVSERLLLNTYTLFAYVLPPCFSYYAVALLVILPGTRVLRIALWPLIALLAFRAAVSVDFTGGDPILVYLNINFALIMFCIVVRTLEWSFLKDPLKRYVRPTGSSPSVLMDTLDLSTNIRGVGWNWSKSLRFPPDTRPTSCIWFTAYTLLSALFHSVICDTFHVAVRGFSPKTFIIPSGDTIFDSTMPPLTRYVRSSAITALMAVVIYSSLQMMYDMATIVGVTVFQQDPAQWPPAFDKPWKADSLRDFWGYRWHQLFRRTFAVLGGWPLGSVFGHAGYVLGSFLGSGIFHNVVLLMLNQDVEWWCMLFSFGMMAVGVILERVFTRMTGRRVGGWIGRLWTMAWLLLWGSFMVDGFGRAGMFASSNVFDTASPAQGTVDHYVTAFDGWLRKCAS
ncbi:membrane bound O-acyl transferase family-domain-containing protein [Pisolithus marmoratus]|nr:membrane bound O-acyl transferase family-domain-containing protein [Pisolithus marmoratus]